MVTAKLATAAENADEELDAIDDHDECGESEAEELDEPLVEEMIRNGELPRGTGGLYP